MYTVVAVDRADLQSEPSAPSEVAIDLTPPSVVLRSPDEGAHVRGIVDVIGTAFAENDFKEYRLSSAPLERPESPTLLRRSSVPTNFQTLFQWEVAALDGEFLLTLEGEDTSGNVVTDVVRVKVDNQAPDAPNLLSVTALPKPDDVEVVWDGPDDPDLQGFLVFRNRQIANAPPNVGGDLTPYLVPGPSYVDEDLPDGRHCYRVVAMDRAGNLGTESGELCVVLDNRAPQAIIFDPENGARFDAPRPVRAVVEDEDVVSVVFQYQVVNENTWTDIATDVEAPFETLWDIAGLDFGDYLLRAVATDAGARSDPDPETVPVTLGDATPPAVPQNVVTEVDGDAVTVRWDAVVEPDTAGYRLYRDGGLVVEVGLVLSVVDSGVADGLYEYTVSSFDGDEASPAGTTASDKTGGSGASTATVACAVLDGALTFSAASTATTS